MQRVSPARDPSRPRVLALLPGLIPSTLISVVKPLLALHQAGRVEGRVVLEGRATAGDVAAADLVLFCRNIEPQYRWHEVCRQLGKPYIYDLDDNFFALPRDTEEGRYLGSPERLDALRGLLAGASLVRIYAEPLAARVELLNPGRVHRVDPSLDWSLIPEDSPRYQRGPLRAVYVTSRLDDRLSSVFMPALEQALERYRGRLRVCFWGPENLGMRGRSWVEHRRLVADYDSFLTTLAGAGFEMGLAPLADDEFHRSKTNNKYREYGACGIAGIYSDVSVYSSCVRDGETGLLAGATPGEWLRALQRLVEDEPLRRRIQAQAKAAVRQRYSQERAVEEWSLQIDEVLRMPPRDAHAQCDSRFDGAVAAPPPITRLVRAQALVARAGRVAGRVRRTGVRATWSAGRRYAQELRLLRRVEAAFAERYGSRTSIARTAIR